MKGTRIGILVIAVLLFQLFIPASVMAAEYTPKPQTEYAKRFIAACEGQTWFIDEVERLLNKEQRTLNTVTGPEDFAEIKSIGLRDQNISGCIPSAIGELKSLRYLFLSDNHLSGNLPSSVYTLPELQNIDLSGNDYTGTIPSGFGTMPALKILELKDNRYTGEIPDTILSNNRIEVLNLKGNKLTGGFPAVSGMSSLKYLNLSENDIGGTIPDLSMLTNLISLSAWRCNLTGMIPENLYTLCDLQILDLSENNLDGEITARIAELSDLQYLALDNNSLHGVLPDAFTQGSLAEIHLENNYLRGFVPKTLKARYEAGAKIYLGNNYMTGNVLKNMQGNSGNFTDGASEQYRLTTNNSSAGISKEGVVNLYALLLNKSLSTGSMSKVLLRPDEYIVTYAGSKVEVTNDSNGIYVRALTDIPLSENFNITIAIRDNDGSEYSRVNLILTTDTALGGGGTGGSTGTGTGTDMTQGAEHKQYINGFIDGTFRAGSSITREQTAKMLVDALKKEAEIPRQSTYTDVAKNRWSYSYIEGATDEGYMIGYTGGIFKPEAPITRAEMATVLSRIAAKEGFVMNDTVQEFQDVSDEKWYSGYVRQAVQYGLISGYTDGTFRPEQYITRAETVTMINRMLGRDYETMSEKGSMICPFSDVKPDSWSYGDIMEAAVTHKHR